MLRLLLGNLFTARIYRQMEEIMKRKKNNYVLKLHFSNSHCLLNSLRSKFQLIRLFAFMLFRPLKHIQCCKDEISAT